MTKIQNFKFKMADKRHIVNSHHTSWKRAMNG